LDGTVVAAIGVIGPSVRMTRQRMIEIGRIVKKYAQDISEAMGYSGNRHK
jgi:DNA-binding IclR family transcriptional regulator